MEKSLGILLNFWGVFQFTHTLPLPSSHKQRWTHVSRLFLPQSQLCIGQGRENYKKILKSMHCFMVAFVQTPPLSCPIVTEGREGGSVHRLFYEGAQKVQKVINTIMNTEIMNTFPKTFVQDCISITIIFLPPMFASLYFYSFPSSTTTTTTIRNKTCLRNFLLCISLIINMKKQKRKIKNVVSAALIIHQANTNSDIICFRAKNCCLIFIC